LGCGSPFRPLLGWWRQHQARAVSKDVVIGNHLSAHQGLLSEDGCVVLVPGGIQLDNKLCLNGGIQALLIITVVFDIQKGREESAIPSPFPQTVLRRLDRSEENVPLNIKRCGSTKVERELWSRTDLQTKC
jgi:hypothetical protein